MKLPAAGADVARRPDTVQNETLKTANAPNGSRTHGLPAWCIARQRPGTAKGVIFATLEDETGVANVVVWPDVFERYRAIVLKASLLLVKGRLQREGLVIHLVAERITDMTPSLATLASPGLEAPALETPLARADEVKRPGPDPVLAGATPSQLGRHPRQVNPLQKSRDFH